MMVRCTAESEPLPGYRLLERLGSGGFGEVWKAEAPGGLFKAIKFVRGDVDEVDGDASAKQEFKALQRVKNLHHPFLLSLERVDVIDGQLVIVMELADCNLMQRFEECRGKGLPGIPRDELLHYMEEAAEALDMMNEDHQLQHMDVKPQNLFLIRNHVKVADFGLAKDLEGTHAALSSGITPTYAAPETFEGKVSHFCDQYSLAIVYQELLTGQRPFRGKNARHLLMEHLTQPPDLTSLPEADRAAVGRALAKVPAERFPSCLEFVRALPRVAPAPGPLAVLSPAAAALSTPAAALSTAVPSTAGTKGRVPPTKKIPTLRPEVSGTAWLCPRCGQASKKGSVSGFCAKCGYCEALDVPAASGSGWKTIGGVATWLWVLLAGIVSIGVAAVIGDRMIPSYTENRALWGLGQLVGGLGLVVGGQVWATILVAAADGRLCLKDIFLSPGRVWLRVAQYLPDTRWPVYLLSWGAFLAICGACLGDLGYWGRHQIPNRTSAANVRKSIANMEDDASREERQTLSRFEGQGGQPSSSSDPKLGKTTTTTVPCVVVGYIPSDDGKSISGVLMATPRDGKLVQTDVVEQGYTPEQREELLRRLRGLERPKAPAWWKGSAPDGVVWVQADSSESVVCEVECDRVDEKTGKPQNPRYKGLSGGP